MVRAPLLDAWAACIRARWSSSMACAGACVVLTPLLLPAWCSMSPAGTGEVAVAAAESVGGEEGGGQRVTNSWIWHLMRMQWHAKCHLHHFTRNAATDWYPVQRLNVAKVPRRWGVGPAGGKGRARRAGRGAATWIRATCLSATAAPSCAARLLGPAIPAIGQCHIVVGV